MTEIPRLSRKERVILTKLVRRGELYGLELVKSSKEIKLGAVYVILGRMVDKGYVEVARKVKSAEGGSRKMYRSTELGIRLHLFWEFAELAWQSTTADLMEEKEK